MAEKPKRRKLKAEAVHFKSTAGVTMTATVKRGPQSWAFLYTFLGFALTIETGVVGLIAPLQWPCNLLTLIVVGAITVYLFLCNGWFQNKLIGLKARYEEKER